jgi:carbon storage regulator CsrA
MGGERYAGLKPVIVVQRRGTWTGRSFLQTEALRMLVLTRRSKEAVVVGGSVGFERLLKVTVLEIYNGKVRLGFEVDEQVPVHRLEVWERIRAEQTGTPGIA